MNWAFFKKYLFTRLKVLAFVFAFVGWLMLFIFTVGLFFIPFLVWLEKVFRSQVFIWTLRIFIFALIIFLIRGEKFVTKAMKDRRIRKAVKVIMIGGAIGWLLTFLSMLF